MSTELELLRDELCKDAKTYCRECFVQSPHAAIQNPPNVFRAGRNLNAKVFLIFDKPNDNDRFRDSDLIPISIFDPRPEFGRQPSQSNLQQILRDADLNPDSTSDPLDSRILHITNAVKCDRCAVTGENGQIEIKEAQVRRCAGRFLFRELAIVKPLAVVFFGPKSQRYVMGKATRSGEQVRAQIDGIGYWVVRLPHPSPQSFNTHGGGGENYKVPLRELMARVTATDPHDTNGLGDRAVQATRPVQHGAEARQILPDSGAEPPIASAGPSAFRHGSSDIPYGSRMYRTRKPYEGSGKRAAIWTCWHDGCTVEEFVKLARRAGDGGPEDLRIYYHLGVIRLEPTPTEPIRKPR
jgi:hypothetical protein